MVGWFANSIMAGYDEALRRSTRRADKLREALAALVGAKDRDTLIQMRSVILATGGDAAAAALEAVNVLIEDYHAE